MDVVALTVFSGTSALGEEATSDVVGSAEVASTTVLLTDGDGRLALADVVSIGVGVDVLLSAGGKAPGKVLFNDVAFPGGAPPYQ